MLTTDVVLCRGAGFALAWLVLALCWPAPSAAQTPFWEPSAQDIEYLFVRHANGGDLATAQTLFLDGQSNEYYYDSTGWVRCNPPIAPNRSGAKAVLDMREQYSMWMGPSYDRSWVYGVRLRHTGEIKVRKGTCDDTIGEQGEVLYEGQSDLLAYTFGFTHGYARLNPVPLSPQGELCFWFTEDSRFVCGVLDTEGPDAWYGRFSDADLEDTLVGGDPMIDFPLRRFGGDLSRKGQPRWNLGAFDWAPDGTLFAIADRSSHTLNSAGQSYVSVSHRFVIEVKPDDTVIGRIGPFQGSVQVRNNPTMTFWSPLSAGPILYVPSLNAAVVRGGGLDYGDPGYEIRNNPGTYTGTGLFVFPKDEPGVGFLSLSASMARAYMCVDQDPDLCANRSGTLSSGRMLTGANGRLYHMLNSYSIVNDPLAFYEVVIRGLDNFDLDGDGLTVAQERALGTSPFVVDSDGGGSHDGAEVLVGTDPLDDGDDLARRHAEDPFWMFMETPLLQLKCIRPTHLVLEKK